MKKIISVLGFLFVLFIYGCTNTKINVSFETNGGSEITAITSLDDIKDGLPTPTKEGYLFVAWYEDAELTIPFEYSDERTSWEFTLYAKWQLFSLTIYIDHYKEALDGSFVFEERDTNPSNLNFSSIDLDASGLLKTYPGFSYDHTLNETDSTSVPGTIIIKFKYTRNIYNITIDEAGGNEIEDISVKFGHDIPEIILSRVGYAFNGFTPSLPETMPIGGLTVTANWTAVPPVTVTFETNGGSSIDPVSIANGAMITAPVSITKLGYEIEGWYTDSNLTVPFVFTTAITSNLTLYAKWAPVNVYYNVRYFYESLEGFYELESDLLLQALTGSTITITSVPSSQFTINLSYNQTINTGTVKADGSLILMIFADRNDYTISFETNASLAIASIVAPYDQTISAPTNPIRTNYQFLGWYSDSNLTIPYTFSTMPGENLTLYAKWIGEDMHLYFNSLGGSVINEIIAPYHSVITSPVNPTYDGYDFLGWFTDPVSGTLFDNWTMPSGNITLYARWSPKQYTLTYETNGGTLIAPTVYSYQAVITKPENPTKTDYSFKGWYLDQEFTTPFTFTTMPANDVTIYAKWISALESTYLENIITLDEGTFVETNGIIYAKQTNGYTGFYILDDTAQLFVSSDSASFSIGDAISLSGIIHYWNGVPTLMHVSNMTLKSAENPIPELTESQIVSILLATPSPEVYSSRVKIKGLVVESNGHYFILNPSTGLSIEISSRFYTDEDIIPLVNSYVTAELLYLSKSPYWQFGLISYQTETLTDQQKADFSYNYVIHQIGDIFYSGDVLEIPAANPFGFGSIELIIDTRNEAHIETVTNIFKTVVDTTMVILPFKVTVNDIVFNYETSVTLEPFSLSTIADYRQSDNGDDYFINALIASVISEDYRYLIIDETGYIYLYYNGELNVGDEILLHVLKNTDSDETSIPYQRILSLEKLSEENNVINQPQLMSISDVNLLDPNDPSVYGKYVELRGFLTFESLEYHDLWQLTDETQFIHVEALNYSSYETLFEWMEREVIMRGYLDVDYNGNFYLNFIGVRFDIQLPVYTDQELIDAIMTSFSYFYGNKVFEPFEEFILYPYHPVLGGEITWTFLNGSENYYDFINNRFTFVDAPVDISIEMVISKNAVSQTYVYNTTLNPFQYTKAIELVDIWQYETVYVKGLVIYRTPNEVYLLDDTGIIRIEAYDLDVYQGDYVVIKGIKYTSYQDSSPYVSKDYDNDGPMIMAIISRYNDVVIPASPLTLEQLTEYPAETATLFNQYVTLSGLLYGDTTGYDYFYLTNGEKEISIWPVDEYTYYQLARFVDLNGDHVFATIKGFVLGYTTEHDCWTILYTGRENDVVLSSLSDFEKANIIENHLKITYETDYIGGDDIINLPTTDPFFGIPVTYLAVGENAATVNLTTNVISSVTTETIVGIEATFSVGEVTRIFTFNMTVLPPDFIPEIEDYVPIDSLNTVSPYDTVRIQGIIYAIGSVSSGYVFLIKDETAMIFVQTGFNTYYYNYSMIGKTMDVTGNVSYSHGRMEFIANQYSIGSVSSGLTISFTEMLINDLETIDIYDQLNYGQGVEVTGKLIYSSLDSGYLLITDNQIISLIASYPGSYDFSAYQNFDVKIKGFFYGQYSGSNKDTLSLIYTNYNYGYGANLTLAETDEQVLADSGLEIVLSSMPKYLLNPYDNYYFMNYLSALPTATINYEVVFGMEYAEVSGYQFYTHLPSVNSIATIRITVTYGTKSATADYDVEIKGFAIGTLEDLITVEDGTLKFAVTGTVIHYGWGFLYVLVDNQVYYLERFLDYYPEMGQQVLISGYKSVIDGKADFSYDIAALPYGYSEVTVIPSVDVLIYDLYFYENLIYSSGLYQNFLNITAVLKYDKYADMFYLEEIVEDTCYKVYIREFLPDEMEYFALESKSGILYRSVLFDLIGETVSMKLLFNFHTTLDTYFVLDFRGYEEDMDILYAESLQAMDNAIYRLQYLYSNLNLQSGDYLLDYLPFYDSVYEIYFDYYLKNTADSAFVFLEDYGFISQIDEEYRLVLDVFVGIYDYDLSDYLTTTTIITVTISPLPVSSVKDVLYGVIGDNYYFKGIIEFAYSDYNEWIILNDGVNRIYVDCYGCLSYRDFVYQTGDEIELIGMRSTYSNNGYVPIVEDIAWLNVISSGHVITPTPVTMTIADILALDYTNPEVYGYYIEITGTIVFSGNPDYPSFDIHLDEYVTDDYDLQLWDDDYSTYDDRFYPLLGQTVTVRGYLIGFEYIYSTFDWILYVDTTSISE